MIVNKASKKTLVRKVELADSLWKQTRGLMFRKSLPKGSGLLMDFKSERKVGIWMLFMRFPIDLIYINSEKKVVDIKGNVKPVSLNPLTWRVYYPKKPARYVLEVPAGTAGKTKIGESLDCGFS